MSALRRGICPTIVDPLPTGDGLLARWTPLAPLALDSFTALCEATAHHGNGIIEVTQRGSLQFRGFSASSARAFADAAQAIGLIPNAAPVVLVSPLFGLDPEVSIDLRDWLISLRTSLTEQYHQQPLNPKVSLVIDDCGPLGLQDVHADLRLTLGSVSRMHVSVSGSADTTHSLGWGTVQQATLAVFDVLDHIVARGPCARAKDVVPDIDGLRSRKALLEPGVERVASSRKLDAFSARLIGDGRLVHGVALPFGYGDARQLKILTAIARDAGADALRPAPQRMLLVIGVQADAIQEFCNRAEAAGFIVTANDVRRQVIACAGAPACQTAKLATREIAAQVAAAARGRLAVGSVIHLSGCQKGCAHPRAAALTFVGPDRLVAAGRADGQTVVHMTPTEFIGRLPTILGARAR